MMLRGSLPAEPISVSWENEMDSTELPSDKEGSQQPTHPLSLCMVHSVQALDYNI